MTMRKVTLVQLPLALVIATVALPAVAQDSELEVDLTTGELRAIENGEVSEGAIRQSELGGGANDNIANVTNEVQQAIGGVSNEVQQVISNPVVQGGVGAVGQVSNAIENPSLTSIGDAVGGLGDLAGDTGLDGVAGTLGQIGNITSSLGGLIGGANSIFESIQSSIDTFLGSARSFANDFLGSGLSQLGRLFPSLNNGTFDEGVKAILEDLQTVLPFIGSRDDGPGEGVLGVLGIPDFDRIGGDILSRNESIDETILSLGITDNTIDPSTQYYKTEAIAATFEGLSNEFLSIEGQQSTMEFLQSTKNILQSLDGNVVTTGQAVANGLSATTSFERLGVLLEERKLAAIRDQQTAALLEAVLLSNERVAPLLAADVMLASRQQQMENRELVKEQRQQSADIAGELQVSFPPLPSGRSFEAEDSFNPNSVDLATLRGIFGLALAADAIDGEEIEADLEPVLEQADLD